MAELIGWLQLIVGALTLVATVAGLRKEKPPPEDGDHNNNEGQ